MRRTKRDFKLREPQKAVSTLALISTSLPVFVVLISLLFNQVAVAQVGVSLGYVDPGKEHFDATLGFTVFADYVFPNTGVLLGVEAGYLQKTEALIYWELWYNPYYGYYYYELDVDATVTKLTLQPRLGWQLPKRYGPVLPYLGICPGICFLKAKVVAKVEGLRVTATDSVTKFGMDFFGGLRFNVIENFGPFIAARYSLIADSDWDHLFVGGGVEFYLFD